MSRIVTIHPAKEIHRYGFESPQVYRARIARHLGLEYVYLVSSPQLRPDWKKDLIKLGFLEKELIFVPHIFSDMEQADYGQSKAENIVLAAHYSLGKVVQSYRKLLDRTYRILGILVTLLLYFCLVS